MPFTLAGSVGILLATSLLILIPNDSNEENHETIGKEKMKDEKKQLTFKEILMVIAH